MILSFKTHFPWKNKKDSRYQGNERTYFVEKILQTDFWPKLHSIRRGHRWKAGMKIQFATGARTKKYNCFKEGICVSTQEIVIEKIKENTFKILIDGIINFTVEFYLYQGQFMTAFGVEKSFERNDFVITDLPKNDGFYSWSELCHFFDITHFTKDITIFDGQIIHWTNLKY